MHIATEKLRQARRCEQITTRMRGIGEVGDDKKAKYIKYNAECIQKLIKNLNDKEGDEHELKVKFEARAGDSGGEPMLILTLLRATRSFHEKHDS